MSNVDCMAGLRAASTIDDLAAVCGRAPAVMDVDLVAGIEQRNALRGARAASALVEHVRRVGVRDDFDANISDLVCELRHLADVLGVDWGGVMVGADTNYAAEVRGG
jgi:hypothetical protein